MTNLQRSKLRNLVSKASDILVNQNSTKRIFGEMDKQFCEENTAKLDKQLIDIIIAVRQLGDEMLGRTNL